MPLQFHKATQTQQPRPQQTNPQTQTNHTQSKKQPTITNPLNFMDENGEWIQCLTKGFRPKCTSVHEGATPKSNEEDNARIIH